MEVLLDIAVRDKLCHLYCWHINIAVPLDSCDWITFLLLVEAIDSVISTGLTCGSIIGVSMWSYWSVKLYKN